MQRPHQDMTLQQRAVVAEEEMICAADCDLQPPVRWQVIVNGLNVGLDLTGLRVGFAAVVAEDEHEWLMETLLNHAAERLAVHINPGLTPGIVVAELKGCRSTKGMTKYSDLRHVQARLELARRVCGIQPFQAIEHEANISDPRGQHSVYATFPLGLLLALAEFRVVLRRSSHYPAVRENDDARAIGSVEA